jgi:hypothetical protein
LCWSEAPLPQRRVGRCRQMADSPAPSRPHDLARSGVGPTAGAHAPPDPLPSSRDERIGRDGDGPECGLPVDADDTLMVGLHRPSITSYQAVRGRPPEAASRGLGTWLLVDWWLVLLSISAQHSEQRSMPTPSRFSGPGPAGLADEASRRPGQPAPVIRPIRGSRGCPTPAAICCPSSRRRGLQRREEVGASRPTDSQVAHRRRMPGPSGDQRGVAVDEGRAVAPRPGHDRVAPVPRSSNGQAPVRGPGTPEPARWSARVTARHAAARGSWSDLRRTRSQQQRLLPVRCRRGRERAASRGDAVRRAGFGHRCTTPEGSGWFSATAEWVAVHGRGRQALA